MKHHALPLDFSLLNNSNDEAVLFLDGPQDMVLRLYNNAPVPLVLNHLTKEHHFTLRFRSGALRDHKGIRLDDAGHKHWHLDTRVDENRDIVLELRRKAEADVTWATGETLELRLDGLRGQTTGGTRATRIELTYDHMRPQGEDTNLFAAKPRHHQLVLMPAMSRGAQNVPLLEAHFVGETGNVVLNNGDKQASALVLRLTNTTAEPLEIGQEAAFYLTLPEGEEDLPGALANKATLLACEVTAQLLDDVLVDSPRPLRCLPLLDRAAWKIQLPEHMASDLLLTPAGGLEIRIEGLATAYRNGPARLHVQWVNLGHGGREAVGELGATLQKSPLVVQGQRLGIGTSQPEAALDVRGDLRLGGRVSAPGPLDFEAPVNAHAGLVVEGSRVGSGTTQPKPALDVRGNVTIAGRISSPGPLEFDTLLKADAGLVLGGVRLVARTLRDERTTRTKFHHVGPYNLESFWRFDDWPLDLAMLDPGLVIPPRGQPKFDRVALVFSLPLPADAIPPLAARGSFRVRVSAAASDGSPCPVSFASPSIPVTVTCSGGTLTATVDMAGAKYYAVGEVPVPLGGPIPSVSLHSWLDPGFAGDLSRLRDMLAAKSVQLRDWGGSYGEKGVDVCWTVEAICMVSVLLAEIDDPS